MPPYEPRGFQLCRRPDALRGNLDGLCDLPAATGSAGRHRPALAHLHPDGRPGDLCRERYGGGHRSRPDGAPLWRSRALDARPDRGVLRGLLVAALRGPGRLARAAPRCGNSLGRHVFGPARATAHDDGQVCEAAAGAAHGGADVAGPGPGQRLRALPHGGIAQHRSAPALHRREPGSRRRCRHGAVGRTASCPCRPPAAGDSAAAVLGSVAVLRRGRNVGARISIALCIEYGAPVPEVRATGRSGEAHARVLDRIRCADGAGAMGRQAFWRRGGDGRGRHGQRPRRSTPWSHGNSSPVVPGARC
jgi:hypothetical protein